MATRINIPSNIRSATWYPQYMETNNSISSLFPEKKYGITKRISGIPASSLISSGKATNIRTQYADVNNGVIDYNRTWTTVRTAEIQATRAIVSKPINTTINAGTTYTSDITNTAIQLNDIPASYNHSGISSNGNSSGYEFYSGLNISISIPSSGTVRFQITNSTGSPITLSGKYIFADVFKTVQEIAQAIYNLAGARENSPIFAELTENGIPYNKVEEIYRELYLYMKSQIPSIQSPADTELYSDYFAGINGYSGGENLGQTSKTVAQLRDILSSQTNAQGTNAYYTNSAFNYRNRMIGGYFNGIPNMFNGAGLYSQIFETEREFMALETRKVGVFGWGAFEGVGRGIDGQQWQRLPLQGGDLIRLARAQGSFEMGEDQAFISMFFGNTLVLWHDNGQYGTNINCWDKAYIGGNEPWKTRWQPTGGADVQYDANNSSHPKSVCQPGENSFSDSAADNLNGFFAGIWLYNQIKDRTNIVKKYATFGYINNAGVQTGYASTNTPVMGSKGNGSINTFGNSNPGQYNIINQWDAKKPLVWESIGTGGTAIIILNIYAGLTEAITYNITTQNHGVQSIVHTGSQLGVYTI